MNILPGKKVSFKEKIVFTKHVSTMINAGIPLLETLDTVKEYAKNSYFEEVLTVIKDDIENGSNLKTALEKFPKVFDHFFIGIIGVGEESGTLAENLKFLSDQMNKEYRLRAKIKSALAYPAIIFIAMLVMGTFISLFVLPRLVDFFGSFDIDLPLPTKILLFLSILMRDHGLLIFAGLATFLVGFRMLIGTKKFKPIWHLALLKMPLIGELIQFGQLASFGRNMGLLLRSGVTAINALTITSNSLSIIKFKDDISQVARSLDSGNSMGDSLDNKKYWEFPPMISRMVKIGEKSGKLEDTFNYVGDFYEDEIDNLSKNLSTILEPFMLVVIGLGVGFLALAIISPIYELTGSIG